MVDPLCVATQGLQSRETHQFALAVATLGWICLAVPVPPAPPAAGGMGPYSCPPWQYTACDEPQFVSAKAIAAAIAVVVVGRSDPLRVAATIALTVDGGTDDEDGCE